MSYLLETYIEETIISNSDLEKIKSIFTESMFLEGDLNGNLTIDYTKVYVGNLTLSESELKITNSLLIIDNNTTIRILRGSLSIIGSYLIIAPGARLYINNMDSELSISRTRIFVDGNLNFCGNGIIIMENCKVEGESHQMGILGLSSLNITNCSLYLRGGITIKNCGSVGILTTNLTSKLTISHVANLMIKLSRIRGRVLIQRVTESIQLLGNYFDRPIILERLKIDSLTQFTFDYNYVGGTPLSIITEDNVRISGPYGEVAVIGASNVSIEASTVLSIVISNSKNISISGARLDEPHSEIFVLDSTNVAIGNISISSIWGSGINIRNSVGFSIKDGKLVSTRPTNITLEGCSNISLHNFSVLVLDTLHIHNSTDVEISNLDLTVNGSIIIESSRNIDFRNSSIRGVAHIKFYENIIGMYNSTAITMNSCELTNLVFDIDYTPRLKMRLEISNTTLNSQQIELIENVENASLNNNVTHLIVFNSDNFNISQYEIQTLILINVSNVFLDSLTSLRYVSANYVEKLSLRNISTTNLAIAVRNTDEIGFYDSSLTYCKIDANLESKILIENDYFEAATVKLSASTLELLKTTFVESEITLQAEHILMINNTFNSTLITFEYPDKLLSINALDNTINGAPLEFVFGKSNLRISGRSVGGILIAKSQNILLETVSAETIIIYDSYNVSISCAAIRSADVWCLYIYGCRNIVIRNSSIEGPTCIIDSNYVVLDNILVNITIRNAIEGDAICVYNSDRVSITDSYIFNMFASLVYSYFSRNLILSKNMLIGYSFVLDLKKCSNIAIMNNTFGIRPYKNILISPIRLRHIYNITIHKNILPASFRAINLNYVYLTQITSNEIRQFRIISMYKSVLSFIYNNILIGGYHMEIRDSSLVWVSHNTIEEKWWYAARPQIYVENSRFIIIEKNILMYGVMFLPIKVLRSEEIFIVRNKSPLMLRYKAEGSSGVYVIGNFLGMVNLESLLICILSLYGLICLFLFIWLRMVRKNYQYE